MASSTDDDGRSTSALALVAGPQRRWTVRTFAAGAAVGLALAARLGLVRGTPSTVSAIRRREGVDIDRPGALAATPDDLGTGGWTQVLGRVKDEMRRDNVPLLAGGVAFYALLALAPAIVALVAIYGLVADPADVQGQVTDLLATAPTEVRTLVTDQLERVAGSSGGGLGLTVAIGVLTALWSASAAVKHLISALNAAYDEDETRSGVTLRLLALAGTLGGVLVLAAMIFAASALPALVAGTPAAGVIGIARWPVLLAVVVAAIAVLYRYAPDRSEPCWAWTAPGTLVAAALLVAGSIAFSLYTSSFGSYDETYGSLAGVVVVMLWLLLNALFVILGAELNAEAERQTLRDTTGGGPQPLGERGATVADEPLRSRDVPAA